MSQHARRYRILYFACAPFISGAEVSLVDTLQALDRDRFEPRLILGCESDLVQVAHSINVPTRVIPMPLRDLWHWPAWWRSRRAVESELERFRPHIVHANEVPSCQAMSISAGKRSIPRVIHVRWPVDAASMGWWARSGCEQILCVSQWIRNQLGNTAGTPLAGAKVSVLFDPYPWTQRVEQDRGSASPSDVGPRRLRLGFAGQLVEVKGLDLVIRALAQLPPLKRPLLLVAGKDAQTGGAHERRLQHLASELGVADNIEWLGFLDDVAALYRQVNVMVCPSRIEPFSRVPLEAAEFTVPTLASDLGGFRESVREGVTGYLVEPTVEAWVERLRSIEGPEQLRLLGVAARRHVIATFSATVYQNELTRCYLDLVGEGRDID